MSPSEFAHIKIVLAPDSFKESLSAAQVCEAMERGIRKVGAGVKIVKLPLADGGEGTVRALVSATKGEMVKKKSLGQTGGLCPPNSGFYRMQPL